jgi:hypothetical protein
MQVQTPTHPHTHTHRVRGFVMIYLLAETFPCYIFFRNRIQNITMVHLLQKQKHYYDTLTCTKYFTTCLLQKHCHDTLTCTIYLLSETLPWYPYLHHRIITFVHLLQKQKHYHDTLTYTKIFTTCLLQKHYHGTFTCTIYLLSETLPWYTHLHHIITHLHNILTPYSDPWARIEVQGQKHYHAFTKNTTERKLNPNPESLIPNP